ncbi:ATP-binding protein [Spirillospora sp. NBC_01491]|uniref:ATP-binding protein n=1 Tax=Spirillospora sp. NBC_01491 TaxID=2976007 RepID=UPI002E329E59|nr:ATP-binding protein [Spirillospora sp. NBC_01491]
MRTAIPQTARPWCTPWSARIWRLPRRRTEHRARSILRDVLARAGVPDARSAELELVAAELAANGVRHARPPYELRVLFAGSTRHPVWCELADSAPSLGRVPELLGAPSGPGPGGDRDALIATLALGGRGLALVHGLTAGRCAAYPTITCTAPGLGKAVGFSLLEPPGVR